MVTYASPAWDPFRDLDRVFTEFSRILDRGRAGVGTAINVWAGDTAVTVSALLPGADPAKVQCSVEGDLLTITAQRSAPEAGADAVWHRRERDAGELTRVVQLPFAVEDGKAQARLVDGVLTITLPRAAADQPRRIAVQGA